MLTLPLSTCAGLWQEEERAFFFLAGPPLGGRGRGPGRIRSRLWNRVNSESCMQSLQRRLLHYTLRLLCYNTQIAQAGDAKVWKTDRVLARLQVLLLVDASEDQTS